MSAESEKIKGGDVKKAVIMGVGAKQGLGSQLAKRIASEGLHVFVASRTQSRLDALTVEIEQAGGGATAVCADATNEEQVIKLFEKAGSGLDLAIYNTGNNFPGQIIDMDAEYFLKSWESCCFGGFLFGREAVRHMVKSGRGLCYSLVQALHCGGGPILVPSIPQRQDYAHLLRQWPRKMVQREFM